MGHGRSRAVVASVVVAASLFALPAYADGANGEPAEAPDAEPQPPTEAPPAPASSPTRRKVPAYVTGAVAIVAAGAGIGLGISALSQAGDFKQDPTALRANRGEKTAFAADVLFGTALTFAISSVVLFFAKDKSVTAFLTPRTAPLRF